MGTESTILQRIRKEIVEPYDASLKATDPRFRHAVVIIDAEGSVFHVRSAFVMRYEDKRNRRWDHTEQKFKVPEYIIVFAEHHRTEIYCSDEVEFVVEYIQAHEKGIPLLKAPK